MNRCRVLITGLLLVLLISQVPIFMQLTLTPDAVLYDVQARCLLEGGVLYRDVLEPNLPGVVWIHALVRSVAGWSPEVLRAFDLVVVVCSCWLLVRIASEPSRRTPSSPGAPGSATFSPWKGAKGVHVDQSLRDWNDRQRRDINDAASVSCCAAASSANSFLFLSLLTFYMGTSEWCHCQRDVWMLLPSLSAVTLRLRVWRMIATGMEGDRKGQLRAGLYAAPNRKNTPSSGLAATFSPCEGEKGLGESHPEHGGKSFTALRTGERPRLSKSIVVMGVLEGMLWAAAFWLKPFVAVPAIAVMIASNRFAPSFRLWGLHSVAVVFGGLLVGGVGILWMIQSSCWPYFIDTLTDWNGDYFQSGRSRWTVERFVAHAGRFWPWILLHGPALLICGRMFFDRRTVGRRSPDGTSADQPSLSRSDSDLPTPEIMPRRTGPSLRCTPTCESLREALLQALYLGWMLQAFLLQQMFDYIHVPGVLLAVAVCARAVSMVLQRSSPDRTQGAARTTSARVLIIPMACAIAVLVLAASPLIRPNRLQHWPECVRACFGAELSPTSKDELALSPFPRWSELQPMLDHVKAQQIPDRSLMAYNGNLIHLYPELTLRPPTRFVYLDVLARLFPDRRILMAAELSASDARWVVSDLIEDGWEGELDDDELLPEEISRNKAEKLFPYNQTPVFRSGGYVLFRIDQPIGRLTDEYFPLSETAE